jgi:hypothetical protein
VGNLILTRTFKRGANYQALSHHRGLRRGSDSRLHLYHGFQVEPLKLFNKMCTASTATLDVTSDHAVQNCKGSLGLCKVSFEHSLPGM